MMDIGVAIKWMRHGERVARKGWNGKGMWLAIVPPSTVDMKHHIGDMVPFVVMKTADDNLVPWLASQTDLLADDWEVVHADS